MSTYVWYLFNSKKETKKIYHITGNIQKEKHMGNWHFYPNQKEKRKVEKIEPYAKLDVEKTLNKQQCARARANGT